MKSLTWYYDKVTGTWGDASDLLIFFDEDRESSTVIEAQASIDLDGAEMFFSLHGAKLVSVVAATGIESEPAGMGQATMLTSIQVNPVLADRLPDE